MATFDEYGTAAALRDYIRNEVNAQLNQQLPRYRYGAVTSINRTNRTCMVTFAGDEGDVPVKMGSLQPYSVGQIVRVAGLLGDRFVDDVMGQAYSMKDFITRLERTFSHNGTYVSVDGHILDWDGRFIVIGAGRSVDVPAGHWSIVKPAVGTVIPMHGLAAGVTPNTITVDANGVLLPGWGALYYDIPFTFTEVADDTRWHWVGYTGDFDIPETWLHVASYNASDVSTTVTNRQPDTGRVSSGILSNGAWAVDNYDFRRYGDVIEFHIYAHKTAAITAGAYNATQPGNITDEVAFSITNDMWMPRSSRGTIGTFRGSFTSGTWDLSVAGAFVPTDLAPSAVLAANEVCRFSGTYMRG